MTDMTEEEGRRWNELIGHKPIAPPPPPEPRKREPFPRRALRYGPGTAPLIPREDT